MKVTLSWPDSDCDCNWEREVELPIAPFPGLEIGLAYEEGGQVVRVMHVYVTTLGYVEAWIDRCPVSKNENPREWGWKRDDDDEGGSDE